MRFVYIFAFFLTLIVAPVASAQDVSRYLSFDPPEPWVNQLDRPDVEFSLGQGHEINYLLVDNQVRFDETDTTLFLRYAEQYLTPSAVEDNSSLSITFDPSYQRVAFHHLHRIRDGVVSDILDPSLFDMYRAEVDREKLIYNGEMVLAYLVPDVRVGDTLDYAYTIYGRNPALGPNFSGRFQLQYAVPVQRHYKRALVPTGTDLLIKSYNAPQDPVILDHQGETEYVWSADNIPELLVDDNLPEPYIAYPTTYLSSYASWEAVGAHFAPYYAVDQVDSAEIRQIASAIRTEHATDKERLRAALDFVQREIRYLGIEIGPGGFIPRQPDQVLSNRFGDCKDMVVLLSALLAELNIPSTPVLVDLDLRGGIEDFPPSHSAFDHVIVSAEVAGQTYYLDPTRGVQLGDLDHLQQADFGKGLIVAENGPGIVTIEAPQPEYFRDFTDTYDIVSDPDTIFLTSVSRYRMGYADSIWAWYQQEGDAAVNRSFLDYYQNQRPQTEAMTDLEVEVDEAKAEIVITGKYRIPNAWSESETDDSKEFYADSGDLLHDIPNFVGASRTLPYALSHPVRTRQTMRFLLDNSWAIDNEQQSFSRPAFEYHRSDRFADNVYTKEISYISKADKIAADDFTATMADLRNARNDTQVALTINPSYAPSVYDEWLNETDDPDWVVYAYLSLVGLITLIGAVVLRDRDADWREYQIYYPISRLKFIVMTIGTTGLYPVFWAYKNWQWAKTIDAQSVSPFWRAFFSPITNFSLFARIAEVTDDNRLFRGSAMVLAAILLLGTMTSRLGSDSAGGAFDWIFLFSYVTLLAWLPVVAQVNSFNASQPEIVRKNSRFGWPAIGTLVLFLPLNILIVFAMLEPFL